MAYTSDRTGQEIDDTLDDADAHIASTSNPHSVTASQVGLGNVDNTADADKPVSTATQTALDGKEDSLTAASQAEMEAGTESALRSMSPLRVAQAIAALAAGGGLSFDAQGNLYTEDSNTSVPATMTNGLYLTEGLAPTDNPANQCMMWADDQDGNAGTVCFNFESEDGRLYSMGTYFGVGLLAPTRELEVDGDVLAESYETDDSAIHIFDTHTGVVTSNDLAFPADANVVTMPASTINTVSGVTAGAVYYLVALGARSL